MATWTPTRQEARGTWMRTFHVVEEIPTMPEPDDTEDEVTEWAGRRAQVNRGPATDASAPERRYTPPRPVPLAFHRPRFDSVTLPAAILELGPDDESEELELLESWLVVPQRAQVAVARRPLPPRVPQRPVPPPMPRLRVESPARGARRRHEIRMNAVYWAIGAVGGMAGGMLLIVLFAMLLALI